MPMQAESELLVFTRVVDCVCVQSCIFIGTKVNKLRAGIFANSSAIEGRSTVTFA